MRIICTHKYGGLARVPYSAHDGYAFVRLNCVLKLFVHLLGFGFVAHGQAVDDILVDESRVVQICACSAWKTEEFCESYEKIVLKRDPNTYSTSVA